ncbi:MAG: MFS transporter [Nocardioidaceae bacterium]
MRTYTELARHREFRALWTSTALGVAASTMSSLSLATLVHAQTGSALLTALTMFGPSLAQVVGALTLMSAADASPPRRTLSALSAVTALVLVLQAALDLPPAARIGLVLVTAYVLAIGAGVRWGLLAAVLPRDAFALGRSAMNTSVGVMQIVGFATGGILLHLMSVREIFVLAAGIACLSVPVLWRGLEEREPRRVARPGLRETWRGNRLLLRQPSTRPLLLALCVPNGLVVGCEALFVPYAGDSAAPLFVAAAVGMLTGDIVVGRLLSVSGRRRAATWLRFLLAVPFLAFALHPGVPVAALLVTVACVGYAASLAQQELLVSLTPVELSGQVLGVESSARMTCQGLGALLAGAVADAMDTGYTMALLAVASLAASAALTPALRRAAARVAGADVGPVSSAAR